MPKSKRATTSDAKFHARPVAAVNADLQESLSGVRIVTAYNRLDDKRAVNADTDSYGATYTYALSKRTNLNAVLTRFNNKGQGQIAPGGNGFLGGVTASAGRDSTNVAFGIRHTF